MQLLRPPPLRPGDTIGVVAPSFPLLPAWRADYERGLATLRQLGFGVKEGRTLGLRRYWAAGTPQDQADDLNAMFADSDVRAIVAHTGGFPGMSVLDRIDYPTVREVVFDVVGDRTFPIMAELDFGHQIANVPLPIGVEATVDAEAGTLALTGAALA